jgi:hypothetical protein
MTIEPILIDKKNAAQALGICVRSLEYLANTKQIATRKVGRRRLVVYASLKSFARHDTPKIHKTPAPSRAVAVHDGE